MEVHKGGRPINSRIRIKYSGNAKPKVRFRFPNENMQTIGSMMLHLQVICMIVGFVIVPLFAEYNPVDVHDVVEIGGFIFLLAMFWFYLVPSLIYFPIKERWEDIYPKWMYYVSAICGRTKIRRFTPKDVGEDLKFGIPLFSNIFLGYEAFGDFAKKLDYLEIREYEFYYCNSKKKRINEWRWYAEFKLKEKAKSGYLEVKFI
jgi:hypothetical protein